ncbi:hypothetical protein ACIQ6K_14310 [Streptomyces sp. NPDC096354]|uniref:hypothetical protein n=1 Tax=Streptomyces sp. NPDC096354 TaxID=3366088 RepID=UPI003823542B
MSDRFRQYQHEHPMDQRSLVHLTSAITINAYIEEAAKTATAEIRTAQPGWSRSPESLERALPKTLECLSRGVRVRTIYQHVARFNEPMKEYVRRGAELGVEVRTVADSHFDRMVIVDSTVAVVSTSAEHGSACAITDPGVVGFLTDVYDRAWSHGKPFVVTGPHAASTDVVPEIRRRIKHLLMAGHSGSYIARRVGLRKRAYDNHVAAIKAELRASNLVQLGVMLATNQEQEREGGRGTDEGLRRAEGE